MSRIDRKDKQRKNIFLRLILIVRRSANSVGRRTGKGPWYILYKNISLYYKWQEEPEEQEELRGALEENQEKPHGVPEGKQENQEEYQEKQEEEELEEE